MSAMHKLSQRQWVVLVVLTIVWGINWPIMKMGVQGYPPLSFRAISSTLGLPVLALVLVALKVPFKVPRANWAELFWLALFNMILWHGLIILAVNALSSGRAAILGYTMPIFSAVLGAWFFGNRLSARAWGGVAAAALGVVLLLWHELTQLAGRPLGVWMALTGAAFWALGTHKLRHTTLKVPTLTIVFWMTALTNLSMVLLALVFDQGQWRMPSSANWFAILFNATLIYGFSQAAWFYLARSLPPVASTLSVMFIPIVGVMTGAWWLHEVLHWQDWAAVALMAVAIASVLLLQRGAGDGTA
jgi:drug/metabolite transporter (DMT)-like permease